MVTYAYSGTDIFWANIVLSLIAQSMYMSDLFQKYKQQSSNILISNYRLWFSWSQCSIESRHTLPGNRVL